MEKILELKNPGICYSVDTIVNVAKDFITVQCKFCVCISTEKPSWSETAFRCCCFRHQQEADAVSKSMIVDKTDLADDAFTFRGFWQINELFDSTSRLTVGVHEECTADRIGAVFDRLDISFHTVNKKCLN
jgi:hypothetical protein